MKTLREHEYMAVPTDWGWDEILDYVEKCRARNVRLWRSSLETLQRNKSTPKWLYMDHLGDIFFSNNDEPPSGYTLQEQTGKRIYEEDCDYAKLTS